MEKYYKKMTGQKCYLSPISLDDAALYTKWLNDPEVTANLTSNTWCLGLAAEQEFLPKLAKEHNYAIVDLQSESLLGNAGFMDINHLDGTAELGIFIGHKDYWGKGYGEEACRLICRYGFDHLNLQNIILRVFSYNERAIACYKKVGFREIGKRRRARRINRKQYEVIYMDLLPEELE